MIEYKYFVEEDPEPAAGINGFSDVVTIKVDSGDPGGEPGEFQNFMQECLGEWFDGATVTSLSLSEAYNEND